MDFLDEPTVFGWDGAEEAQEGTDKDEAPLR